MSPIKALSTMTSSESRCAPQFSSFRRLHITKGNSTTHWKATTN